MIPGITANPMTRDQLVGRMVEEYHKHGKDAAIALFSKFIKKYEISQHGIKTMIIEFREATGIPMGGDGSKKGNPRKGPIASATGLVDKVYQTVMSPVDALARGADRGFTSALNPSEGEYEALAYADYKLVSRATGKTEELAAANVVKKLHSTRGTVEVDNIQVYKRVKGSDHLMDQYGEGRLDELMRAGLRSNPKSPRDMTAGEINKALDKLDVEQSKITDEFIASGRGHERPSEYLHGTDPLALKAQAEHRKRMDLRMEMERRYGPGVPSRLPKGFGPMKHNPAYSLTIGPRSTSHSTLDSAIRAGTQAARTGMHATFQVTKPGGEVVSFDRTGKQMRINPRHHTVTLSKHPGNNDPSAVLVAQQHGTPGGVYSTSQGYVVSVGSGKALAGFYGSLAEARTAWEAATSKQRSNPADDSATGFEKFHGFPSREIVEVEEEQHIHSNLVGLGTLNGVKIRCLEGEYYCLEFSDNVMLTANESFTQLYIVGGDQKVSLKSLHMEEFEDKESVILGECWCVSYTTEKTFDDEETIDYVHTFGPEDAQAKMPKSADLWNDAKPPHDDVFGTGELPTLRYDVRNKKLYLDGGTYHIDSPLIGVSAGIID